MKKIFGLFFVLIFCTSVFAWDDAGHKISAEIAWRNMTPAAREKAIALLLAAPENSGILNLLASDSRSLMTRQEQMFDTTATWADLIRDKNFPVRNKEFHHGSWHYMDTFWRDVNGRVEIVTDLKPTDSNLTDSNLNEQNAVERLFALEKTLRDPMQPNAERAVALAWILHLAGDIHQPLHCSGRVTTLEPAG
ncbi:MAG: S1/P1 nuclease, partial [Pyrinomonadaceae bacterium]